MEGKLTLENLHEHLQQWKQPYLKEVGKTATEFKQKVQKFKDDINRKQDETEQQINQYLGQNSLLQKSQNKPNVTMLNKKIPTEPRAQETEFRMQEWKSAPHTGFKDYDDLLQSYNNVFNKKQKVKSKKKGQEMEDFRADEKVMLDEIYGQIKEEDVEAVSFEAIIAFFQNCDLFYHYYNIQPYRLAELLKQFAHKYEDKLTKSQFFDFFLIDRPIISEWMPKTLKSDHKICVLTEETWKNLKYIFDTLDTFGNQKISMKVFFQKVKNNASSVTLLSQKAIQYPSINRSYTLQKIFFDLQNKVKYQEKVEWTQIEDQISNFVHIVNPTLDQIYMQNVRQGKIGKDSNHFLLSDQVVKIIKQIFNRCPKYCQNFVKTNFFSYQMLESGLLKPYFSMAVRHENLQKKTFFSLQSMIKKMSKEAPDYLDMDEMLEYFSIKGLNKSKLFGNLNFDWDEISSSESEYQQITNKQYSKLKKIKSLQDLKKLKKKTKKNRKKQFEGTKAKQFNLYKRAEPTIRGKKVQQMIIDKFMEDQVQLNKKFKANPIPVSLNPQRYHKYSKLMQKKKQSILNRLNMKRQADLLVIEYLKSNTKLFESKKLKNHCDDFQRKQYKFQPKPLPMNIHEELLQKIQSQKQERRKHIFEETNKKYMMAWKDIMEKDMIKMSNDRGSTDSLNKQIKEMEKQKYSQFKAHQVPNFKQLHQKFEEQLEKKKKNYQPTKIRQFKLTSPSDKFQRKLQEYYHSPQPNKSSYKKYTTSSDSPEFLIKSTKKYDDWIAFNQTKVAERQIQRLEKEKENEERLLKQKNFAKFMRKNLANCTDNRKYLQKKTQQKLKDYRNYVQRLEKETQQQLAQIYVRVLQRPFLFEQAGETMKKNKKKQNPKKIQSNRKEDNPNVYGGEYPPQGIFSSDGDDFHPMESQNLNQSF